jgi:hypothetical protein
MSMQDVSGDGRMPMWNRLIMMLDSVGDGLVLMRDNGKAPTR